MPDLLLRWGGRGVGWQILTNGGGVLVIGGGGVEAPLQTMNNIFSLIFSQPRYKQNRGCDFLLFKYFLNNLILTVFMQNTLSNLAKLLQ